MEVDGGGQPVGPRLVAKQTRFEELMRAQDFHHAFCRTQAEAQALAAQFNRRARGPPAWAVAFLDCVAYHVRDERWPGGRVQFLAEPVRLPTPSRLGGRFPAWRSRARAGQARAPGMAGGPRRRAKRTPQ
jgi:hypothetical protein